MEYLREAQKVYPTDHPEPDFLDQSNHLLAAAPEMPFWATGEQELQTVEMTRAAANAQYTRWYVSKN